jgi:hypothetical protein
MPITHKFILSLVEMKIFLEYAVTTLTILTTTGHRNDPMAKLIGHKRRVPSNKTNSQQSIGCNGTVERKNKKLHLILTTLATTADTPTTTATVAMGQDALRTLSFMETIKKLPKLTNQAITVTIPLTL